MHCPSLADLASLPTTQVRFLAQPCLQQSLYLQDVVVSLPEPGPVVLGLLQLLEGGPVLAGCRETLDQVVELARSQGVGWGRDCWEITNISLPEVTILERGGEEELGQEQELGQELGQGQGQQQEQQEPDGCQNDGQDSEEMKGEDVEGEVLEVDGLQGESAGIIIYRDGEDLEEEQMPEEMEQELEQEGTEKDMGEEGIMNILERGEEPGEDLMRRAVEEDWGPILEAVVPPEESGGGDSCTSESPVEAQGIDTTLVDHDDDSTVRNSPCDLDDVEDFSLFLEDDSTEFNPPEAEETAQLDNVQVIVVGHSTEDTNIEETETDISVETHRTMEVATKDPVPDHSVKSKDPAPVKDISKTSLCSCLEAKLGRAGKRGAVCRRCGKPSRRKSLLVLRPEEVPGVRKEWKGPRFPCDKCSYVAGRMANLTNHMKSKHEGIMFIDSYMTDYFAKHKLIMI